MILTVSLPLTPLAIGWDYRAMVTGDPDTEHLADLRKHPMYDPLPIINSVLGVFLVMVMGAAARQIGWLNQESDKSLASLTTNVLLPAYFLDKILRSDHPVVGAGVWEAPLFGLLTTSLCFAVSLIFAKRIGPKLGLKKEGSQRAFALCVGVCNYGFIPLPLAEQYYPGAVVDLILHNIGVNLALWSVGIAIIHGSLRDGWRQAILSPPFLSVIFAVALKSQGPTHWIPSAVSTAMSSIGSCAIPMGLILSGAIMVDFLREATWKGSLRLLLAAVTLRHFIFPAMMLIFTVVLTDSVELRQVMLLQAAMPAAVFPVIIVKLYDHDIDTAVRIVLGSSVIGVITIPAWLLIGAGWILA